MTMDRDKKFYWDLFSVTFQLSMFTLGGGFVIVPLMRKKFMEERHWIDEDEMMGPDGDRPVRSRVDGGATRPFSSVTALPESWGYS